ELESHTPPEVTKKMEEVLGGRFMAGQMMVGIEALKCSLKVAGASAEVLSAYGANQGDYVQIDVKESQQDKQGNTFAMHYSYTGEIVSIKEEEGKMGSKPGCTIEIAPSVYKKTENGKICYNLNEETQELDFGKGDIM
ncbi:phage major tail tube protein, partial [Vibrio anguillarum]